MPSLHEEVIAEIQNSKIPHDFTKLVDGSKIVFHIGDRTQFNHLAQFLNRRAGVVRTNFLDHLMGEWLKTKGLPKNTYAIQKHPPKGAAAKITLTLKH